MRMNRTSTFRLLATALALAAAALFLAACDDGSVDSSAGVPSDNNGTIYNYSGLYARPVTNGLGVLVFPPNSQSGTALTWMRLLQYGNVLEGYDNAGLTWSGGISAQNGGVATFNLNGRTTAGNTVSIAGTLATATVTSSSTNGGSTTVSGSTAVMDASWIEPSFAGSIFAQATISPPRGPTAVEDLAHIRRARYQQTHTTIQRERWQWLLHLVRVRQQQGHRQPDHRKPHDVYCHPCLRK